MVEVGNRWQLDSFAHEEGVDGGNVLCPSRFDGVLNQSLRPIGHRRSGRINIDNEILGIQLDGEGAIGSDDRFKMRQNGGMTLMRSTDFFKTAFTFKVNEAESRPVRLVKAKTGELSRSAVTSKPSTTVV